MSRLAHRRARLYQRLRSVHLERAHTQVPASILFTDTSYDFDPALLPGLDIHKAGTLRAAWLVLRTKLDVLEVETNLWSVAD